MNLTPDILRHIADEAERLGLDVYGIAPDVQGVAVHCQPASFRRAFAGRVVTLDDLGGATLHASVREGGLRWWSGVERPSPLQTTIRLPETP